MSQSTTAETCPNVVRLPHFEEKQFYTQLDYSLKGWTWFEGVDFGKIYANVFVPNQVLQSVGFDLKTENYEVLEFEPSQQIYLVHPNLDFHPNQETIIFSPNRQLLERFLQDFSLQGKITPSEAIAQTR